MIGKELHPIFLQMASDDQAAMQRYARVSAIRHTRIDLDIYARNRKKNPHWQRFQDLLCRSYDLFEAPNDELYGQELDLSHHLFIYDYMTGAARPLPARAANMCARLSDLLLVKEAEIFTTAIRAHVKIKGASPA